MIFLSLTETPLPESPTPPRPHPDPTQHPKTREKSPEKDRIGPKHTEMDRIGRFASSLGWGTGGGFVGRVVREKDYHYPKTLFETFLWTSGGEGPETTVMAARFAREDDLDHSRSAPLLFVLLSGTRMTSDDRNEWKKCRVVPRTQTLRGF